MSALTSRAKPQPAEPCKGCGGDIVGFASDGYCEDCLCSECGNTLSTEDERAATMCEECDIARAVAEWHISTLAAKIEGNA